MPDSSSITIDLKKHRLRIFKSTLNQMQAPDYIELLINTSDSLLAIRGIDHRTKEAHKVMFSQFREGSIELYSKDLTEEMRGLLPQLDENCSYRLTGKVHPEKRVALFSFDTLQKLEVNTSNASGS